MMEPADLCEMLAIFYQTAWARVPEDDEELVCADFSDY
jgi:hypothetical protein